MKRILMVFALALLSVSVSAQVRYKYDSGHKYGFFSNWTLGVAGQYSNQQGVSNVGISALATKRVGDYWRLRYEAGINGLQVKDGFDRYGTALTGVCFDFVPWAYAYVGGGMKVDPTSIGLAADAGLGLNVNFGKYSLLYAELGADRVQNNTKWESTLQCRIGYSARLGITERDRVDIDITRHNAEQLGTLTEENRLLKTDLKRQQEANDTLMATLNKASALFAALEKKLDDCNDRVAKAASASQSGLGVSNPIFQIFFDYASAEITPIEAAKVAQLAERINNDGGYYRLEGFASPDGNMYRNEALSQERAYAVYWLLLSHDVDETRIAPVAGGITSRYGDESPLNRMVVVTQIAP